MENLFDSLTANLSGGVHREKLDGRDYFVAPLSLINPGILNGSRGPLMYTAEDAKKYSKAWDGQPVVVYHPTRNGKPISAKDPAVVQVGVVKNSKMSDKLRAEAWIDIENVKEHDERVYDALVNGTPMEVSTGLGTTIEDVPAGTTFNGQPYVGIAREWRADHLALLPDQVGACSLRDGCGLMVNKNVDWWEGAKVSDKEIDLTNCDDSGECEACKAKRIANEAEETVENCKGEVECPKCKAKRLKKMEESETKTTNEVTDLVDNAEQVKYFDVSSILNQLSHEDLRSQLYTLVQERFGTPIGLTGINAPMSGVYIQDVFDKDFVYSSENKWYRLGYSTDLRSDKVTLSEDQPVEVKRVSTYKNVQNLLKRIENCKGTGKPGPCKKGESTTKASQAAHKASESVGEIGSGNWGKQTSASGGFSHAGASGIHKVLADMHRKRGGSGNLKAAKLHDKASNLHAKAAGITTNQASNVLDQIVANGDLTLGGQQMADKKLTETDRLKLVDHLITNSSVWEEEDRETLNALGDVKLYGLAVQEQSLIENADPDEADDGDESDDGVENKGKVPPQFAKKGKKSKAEEAEEETDGEEEAEDEMATNRSRPMTEAQWLAQAPKSIRSVVQNAQRKEAQEKQDLIANMTDHLEDSQQKLMIRVLNTKSLDELELLSALKVVNAAPAEDVANYAGQAIQFRTMNSKAKVDPNDGLDIPTINWAKESKAV